MPDPRRRFCLTSRPVTQSTPEDAPEEVSARVADHGPWRSESHPPWMPLRVLPVIMTCGNMEFTVVSPRSAITERTHCERAVCNRSQVCAERTRSADYSQSEQRPGRRGESGSAGRDAVHSLSQEFTGSHIGIATRMTRPPPSRGSAVITPPCALATERAMDSPSPTPLSLPVRSVRSRRKGSNMLSTS